MAISDEFIRRVNKRSSGGKISAGNLRNLFFDFLDMLPEDLGWDFFNMIFPDNSDDLLVECGRAEKLSVIIDLVEGEYDENGLNLSDRELEYISEGVNDYALELSDDVLMNVMQAAVSRGLMG